VTRQLAETPTPTTSAPLSYASAPYPAGYALEERANGDVVIDLPPVSTALFVTMLAPWALTLVFASLMLFALFGNPTSVTSAWVVAPLALVGAAYWLYLLARHRHVRRIIRVDAGSLSYSNAATGARLWTVAPDRCRYVRVRRCWWRPWTVQIQAQPDVSFWSTRTNLEPVILIIDTNRARLEEVAAMLRRALQAR
jgi:hypothetical protein